MQYANSPKRDCAHAAEFDEIRRIPLDTIKKMGAMGLMGIEVPEDYGGAGMRYNWPMC